MGTGDHLCVFGDGNGSRRMKSLHNRLTILLAIAVVSSVLLLAESVSVSPASADVIDAPTCSTGGAVPDAANNPGLVSDCESLLVGRDTLAGKATLDWSAGRPIAQWEGVSVEGTPARVMALRLISKQLNGKMPPELGDLSSLQGLDLYNNDLSGEIPAELGNLSNLQGLTLSYNLLTGAIPAELGGLTNLRELFLIGNQLSGKIPAEVGDLSSLRELSFAKNRLTGEIPSELGSLSGLEWLVLSGNELTGEIPSELGDISNLQYLELDENQLSGDIPEELGNLSKLEVLALQNNRLTGQIPSEFDHLSNLEYLHLSGNLLTGCIPGGLRGRLNDDFDMLGLPYCDVLLSGLTVSPRALTPPFDPYHINYTALRGSRSLTVKAVNEHDAVVRFLDQNGDEISDGDAAQDGLQIDLNEGITAVKVAVTSPDGRVTRSYTVFFRQPTSCATDGAVPDPTANPGLVTDCETLLAARDTLAGTVNLNWSSDTPIAQWEGITVEGTPARVTRLDLARWELTGKIPPELGSLTGLRVLSLHHNELTGPIPPELGGLINLEILELAVNRLRGGIPPELGSLTNLKEVRLHVNRLTGTLPSELGSLSNLNHMTISFNPLTGAIPAELGNLTNLRSLDLTWNGLTGSIPATLRQPPRLGTSVAPRESIGRAAAGRVGQPREPEIALPRP